MREADLALEELETGTTARADVAELVLRLVVRDNGGGISTTNDDSRAVRRSLHVRVKQSFGASCERGKFKYTRRTV